MFQQYLVADQTSTSTATSPPPHQNSTPSVTAKKTTGIALDSLEPVIVAGSSGTQGNAANTGPNNPSPQNFASSAKGMDLLQGGDILQPRGEPQYVGLTKLTYQAGELQLFQSGTVEPCSSEDFQECFIEKTLNHYYKQNSTAAAGSKGGSSPAKTSPQKTVIHPLTLLTKSTNAVAGADARNLDDLSPERTGGTKKQRGQSSNSKYLKSSVDSAKQNQKNQYDSSSQTGARKDERQATSRILQQAKRTPYEFSKVSFVIALPYEMLVEQLQLVLPPQTKPATGNLDDSPLAADGKSSAPDKGQLSAKSNKSQSNASVKQQSHGAGNMMRIISNNPSHVISMQEQSPAPPTVLHDPRFSSNFKILNISTLKSPDTSSGLHQQIATQHSTDSRHKMSQVFPNTQARQQREHRHMQIKSAFSEDVTGKNTIEINACAVTRYLHITLLCLRSDAAALFNHWKNRGGQSFSTNGSQRRSKTSAFDQSAKTAPQQMTGEDSSSTKVTGAQRLIAEIEKFDILDEHDQEVAFISKQHYNQQKSSSNNDNDGNLNSSDIVDHETIGMQLRGDDEEDFDRDIYADVDGELGGDYQVGNIMQNDEDDDLRILDSLPHMVKPKGIQQNSKTINSHQKKQSSIKQNRSLKIDEQATSINIGGGPLGRFIDKIIVFGFNCNQIPAITNLTYFMNQSFYMRKHKKYYQAEEIDYLVGTLMITTKRATQAAEFYRKIEINVVKRIHRNLTKLEKQGSEDCSSNNATFIGIETEIKQETQNLFIQCALLELLIADGLSFETQLNEKIQALQRLVNFIEGQIPTAMRFAPQVLVYDDSFSALLRILPQLLRFCLLSLTHRREIIRMSALKILKFILETQGCSLDASMIYILKGMFLTFPKPSAAQALAMAQAEKEAAEKLKKQQQSLEDSPSAKSVSTAKAQDEPESAQLKKLAQLQGRVKIVSQDFDLAQLVGESEAATLSVTDYVFHGHSRSSLLSNSANNMIMHDSNVIAVEPESSLYATKYSAIQEPTSGFNTALQNVHTHVLETYISVLSSISSHILHRIFYDVIEDALFASPVDTLKQNQAKHSASFKGQSNNRECAWVEQCFARNQNRSLSGGARGDTTSSKLQTRAQLAQSSQIKVYACKIAEKIITICQGDLNISPGLLSSLIDAYGSQKPTFPLSDSASSQAHSAMKALWNSIKQKVFPNYSTKGYRRLIEWVSQKMNHLMNSDKTHPQDLLNTKPVSQRKDAFPDELSEEENVTLQQLCEVITLVTFNRLKQEEEANQLIKLPTPESFGNGPSSEMYLLLPQLVFWLEYAIDREDRLQLFTQLYSTIKEVLESVPTNGRSRESQLSVVHIMMPSLRRTNEFLKHNSPSLPMLKFMDIALNDIQLCAHERKSKQQNLSLSPTHPENQNAKQFQSLSATENNSVSDPLKLQGFFLELLENFVTSLAYSLYEEAFSVFDKLLYLAGDSMTENAIKKCIVALVDKYTLKSKSHKASMANFMKQLMNLKIKKSNTNTLQQQQSTPNNMSRSHHKRQTSNRGSPDQLDEMIMNENDLSSGTAVGLQSGNGSYFEVMAEFCFFENVDTNYKKASRNGVMRVIDDREEHNTLGMAQLDFRGPIDVHELFVDKLQFFIDTLGLMTDAHIGMFTYLITNHNFKTMLLQLLEHGETNVRMKAHEILETLTSYFFQCCPSKTVYEFPQSGTSSQNQMPDGLGKKMEAEFIAHERLYISQIVIQVAKRSLQQTHDCYLQFNALILLDFLFQNLLPVPTFQNEQVKARKQNRRASQQTPSAQDQATEVELTMDIEVLSISDMTPELDVMDPAYLRMRMKLVMSLWPHIQTALASPWSNIRSICYGLVCSMLKINVTDYPLNSSPTDQTTTHQALSRELVSSPAAGVNLSESMNDAAALSSQEDRLAGGGVASGKDPLILSDILSQNSATQSRLKEIVLPMLHSLLSSKESESKAGGLNILGSFCGLSYDFSQVKINQNLAFLQRNSDFISLPIWRLVYQLQDDWDITIKEASVVLVQLCAPRQAILYFQQLKEKRQQQKLQYLMNQMPNVQTIYVKGKSLGVDDEEEKGTSLRSVRPESRLKIKNYLMRRNENAARAYARFPRESDFEMVLSKPSAAQSAHVSAGIDKPEEASFSILHEQSTLMQDGAFGDQNANFSDYLSGKVPITTPPVGGTHGGSPYDLALTCQNIEQEHAILFDKVQQANPDFEDTRFVQNLSRKRQLEVILDISRGRKKDKETVVNFFVDSYSDEQIQEIISIFRNDFKPPKNLWIEKQPSPMALISGGMSNGAQMSQQAQNIMRSQSPDYYQDIYAEAIELFNQQQAQMQQQQQAQLQQQVQSGSSSGSSTSSQSSTSSNSSNLSRESSALSAQPNSTGGTAPPLSISQLQPQTLQQALIVAESAASIAARLSPQPSGRMIDALEDDQLRQLSEKQQQLQQQSSGNITNSQQQSSSSAKSSGNAAVNGVASGSQSSQIMVNAFCPQSDEANDLLGQSEHQLAVNHTGDVDDKRGVSSPVDGASSADDVDGVVNAFQQLHGEDNGPPQVPASHNKHLHLVQSESMGLLDAEGYKFLEASDSNSGDEDVADEDDHERMGHDVQNLDKNLDRNLDMNLERQVCLDEDVLRNRLLALHDENSRKSGPPVAGAPKPAHHKHNKAIISNGNIYEMHPKNKDSQAKMIQDNAPAPIQNINTSSNKRANNNKRRAAAAAGGQQRMKIEQLNFDGIQICATKLQQQQQQRQQPSSTTTNQQQQVAQQFQQPQTTSSTSSQAQQQKQATRKPTNSQAMIQQQTATGLMQLQQSMQHQQVVQNNIQTGKGPRIEFYQDPGADGQIPQNSSRLGQRSSRQQLQQQQNNSKQQPDEEAKFLMPQKLFKQLQSPTDKISGGGKNAFKSFAATSDGLLQIPNDSNIISASGPTQHRNKSNESRKRKRGQANSQSAGQGGVTSATGSGQGSGVAKGAVSRGEAKQASTSFSSHNAPAATKKKPNHLQLVENDYFSQEDKHVSHLRNLTQKAAHQYQGGLGGPWHWASSGGTINTNASSQQQTAKGATAMHQLLPGGQNSTRHRAKSIGNANSVSTPDFNLLQNMLGLQQKQGQGQGSGGPTIEGGLQAASSSEIIDQNKISRKMAQTYLSGLSRGFISKIDNLKLINTCLHQDQQSTAAGSTQGGANVTSMKAASSMLLNKSMGPTTTTANNTTMSKPSHHSKKLFNKSFENLGGGGFKLKQSSNCDGSLLFDLKLLNPKSTKNQSRLHQGAGGGKNSTLSTSPQRREGSQTTAMNSSANNYQRKQKQLDKGHRGAGHSKKGGKHHQQHQPQQNSSESKDAATGGSGQKSKRSNISDLHHLIKTIEKDLTEKFKSMHVDLNSAKGPATPNQILRKVEDQMRAVGLDPKSGSNQATAQALAIKFAKSEQAAYQSQQQQSSMGAGSGGGALSSHSQDRQSSHHQPTSTAKRKKSLPPKLKLLGLQLQQQQQHHHHQFQQQHKSGGNTTTAGELNSAILFPSSGHDVTPSNLSSNGSGSRPFMMTKSHINIGCSSKKQHQGTDGTGPDRYQRSSGSRGRRKRSGGKERSAGSRTSRHRTKSGQLSTGRGASSGSGGRGGGGLIQNLIPTAFNSNPPMVMTERSLRPAKPATGGKLLQERVASGAAQTAKHGSKSLMKGGSALAKASKPKLHRISKNQQQAAFSPRTQDTSGLGSSSTTKQHHSNMQQHQPNNQSSASSKPSSLSAMNHIGTSSRQQTADQQLLQQLLSTNSGSTSVRNSKTAANHHHQLTSTSKQASTKHTPGSTKASGAANATGTTVAANNILFELIQNSNTNTASATVNDSQSKKQSSHKNVANASKNFQGQIQQQQQQTIQTQMMANNKQQLNNKALPFMLQGSSQ